ncbi:hypothetical protein BpHYR1_042113 [Brachionus plicatilis]|uniref:Uncharacterized protein n=1 Tax=Brachionus plicatilis TaxID=10195 RepID=A0A3M7R2X8_BRAPC|nr:hypothetical protein BpHYR1_042113 [Brachionus plicatilis]
MDSKQIDIYNNLTKLKWAQEPMTLLQLIESLEMPQIAKISRSNVSDLKENDYLLLQSVYDRYLLLGATQSPVSKNNHAYLIPDWYRAQCKIKSSNPRIQKQYWNFQGATELNRFDLPREINFLVETPLYQFWQKNGSKIEWKRVVVKRNTKLTATKLQNYSVDNANRGNCFILVDKKGNKYLLPCEFNIKFSVEIKPDEYNSAYFDHQGDFSLPEVITRYELPVDVSFVPSSEPGSVPAAKLPKTQFKIVSLGIAKSIIGAIFNTSTRKFRYIELSPATQIKLAIPTCLQHGLLNPNASLSKEEENEYTLYNKTREAALGMCHKQCELYKFEMRAATDEERDAMIKVYDAGIKYKKEETAHLRENFFLDLKSKEALNPDAKIPFVALKNIFLRPNIDEGDPYDDFTQEQEENGKINFSHDLSVLPSMPEKLLTDTLTDVENGVKQK